MAIVSALLAFPEPPKAYKVRCFECPLRDCRAFKPRSEEEVALIDRIKRDHLSIEAGGEIIHPGQEDAEIFTLFSGWAYRYRVLPDGRRQILNFLLPGDLIGLQAAMFDAALYGVDALTPVEVCLLSRRQFFSIFDKAPDMAFEIAWLGARQESIVDDNLTTVGRRTASERIAALVLSLYKRADALGLVHDHTFDFPLSQQHIADALGLSLVHTNKTLAKLRREGLFRRSGGRLTLENPRVVERIAQHFDDDIAPRPLI